MKILLVILVLFLLFLNAEIFQSTPFGNSHTDQTEALSVEMPDGESPSFNSNSRNNDYYYDKSGMKGTLFNTLSEPKYMLPSPVIYEPNYSQAIKKLGIYPENFYARCSS